MARKARPLTHQSRHSLRHGHVARRLDFGPEPGRTPQRSIGECQTCHTWCFEGDCHDEDDSCLYYCNACGGVVNQSAVPF